MINQLSVFILQVLTLFGLCLFLTEDPEHNRHIVGFNWPEHDGLPDQDF